MSDTLSKQERQQARERIEQKIMVSSVPLSVKQIEDSLGLSRTTVATALKELSRSGRIAESSKDGNTQLWEWRGKKASSASRAPGRTPGRLVREPKGKYLPEPWTHEFARPGSMDHEKHPSRIGDTLHYRDGRTEKTTFAAQFPAPQIATAK